jgi:DNA invertase Pin-like site-specific DNA recombinase
MRVGYVRVSTIDQNTVRQLDGIEVERVFADKASGKDTTRPKLDEMVAFVRDGDTVLVHSMDRFARNLDDLRRLVRTLTGKGVCGWSSSRRASHSPARTLRWRTYC